MIDFLPVLPVYNRNATIKPTASLSSISNSQSKKYRIVMEA